MFGKPILFAGTSDPGAGSYNIGRSLRFDGTSDYLSRTVSTSGTTKKTISTWIKKTAFCATVGKQDVLNCYVGGGEDGFYFANSGGNVDNIIVTACGGGSSLVTSARFRDPSSWFHILYHIDTTQAISSDRLKIWINGSLAALDSASYPSINVTTDQICNKNMQIGYGMFSGTRGYFHGYLAEFHAIEGLALLPTDFGYKNEITGQWLPKSYSGSYGTNGFYLPFSDGTSTTTLGYDQAGANDWTLTGMTRSAGVDDCWTIDTPTNNFATLSPIVKTPATTGTIGNGGLKLTSGDGIALASWGLPSTGKWMWEGTLSSLGTPDYGIATIGKTGRGNATEYYGAYSNGGNGLALYNGSNTASDGRQAVSANDIGVVAVDCSTNKVWIGRNRSGTVTWMGNGDPVAGTSPTFSGSGGGGVYATDLDLSVKTWYPEFGAFSGDTWDVNFGQRSLATTLSGFQTLCSQNLPQPAIHNPKLHFDVKTYTGNGGNLQVGEVAKGQDLVVIDKSLRLRKENSAYLTKTWASAGNKRKFTISGWVKRTFLDSGTSLYYDIISQHTGTGYTTGAFGVAFAANRILVYDLTVSASSYQVNAATSKLFQDSANFIHIVVVIDTDNATTADNCIVYVNGVRETLVGGNSVSLGSGTGSNNTSYTINTDTFFNTANPHHIGYSTSNAYTGMYLSDFYVVDGYALLPSDFGQYDGNGTWVPKAYTGSYGTNGFKLDFSDPTSLITLCQDKASGSYSLGNALTGGTATANGNSVGNPPSQVIDGSSTTGWDINAGGPHWLKVDLGSGNAKVAKAYSIVAFDTASGMFTSPSTIQDFNLQGSDDDTNWDTLDTRSGVTSWVAGEMKSYTFTNTNDYRYYKLNMTANNGGSNWRVAEFIVREAGSYGLNSWTPSGISVTEGPDYDSMIDTPTNSFATSSSIMSSSTVTLSDGGLAASCGTGSNYNIYGTIVDTPITINTYLEVILTNTRTTSTTSTQVGIIDWNAETNKSIFLTGGGSGSDTSAFISHADGDYVKVPGSSTTDGVTYGTSDVMMIAFNPTLRKVWFGKNGTWNNTSDPYTNSGGHTFASSNTLFYPAYRFNPDDQTETLVLNFGQRPFTTDASTDWRSAAGGYFRYDPPTGFKALCENNVQEYLYDVERPDVVWIKDRTTANSHYYFDSLRGAGKYVRPDTTNTETTDVNSLIAFNKNGIYIGNNTSINTLNNKYLALLWKMGSSTSWNFDGDINRACTFTDAGDLVNITAHNFETGYAVKFTNSGGALPTGITAGTVYYVVNNDTTGANTFQISSSSTGTPIVTFTGTGSGTHACVHGVLTVVNSLAGMSAMSWVGSGKGATQTITVGHGLGGTPGYAVVKSRGIGASAKSWIAKTTGLADGKILYAEDGTSTPTSNNISSSSDGGINAFSSSVLTLLGGSINSNAVDDAVGKMMGLAFREVAGFSKIGTYVGNGSSDGPFVWCGFEPRFLFVRALTAAGNFVMYDTGNLAYNGAGSEMYVDTADYESVGGNRFDILSNGFKNRNTGSAANSNGVTYFFMAFSETPFKYSNAR